MLCNLWYSVAEVSFEVHKWGDVVNILVWIFWAGGSLFYFALSIFNSQHQGYDMVWAHSAWIRIQHEKQVRQLHQLNKNVALNHSRINHPNRDVRVEFDEFKCAKNRRIFFFKGIYFGTLLTSTNGIYRNN